jgi:hypothetical protein
MSNKEEIGRVHGKNHTYTIVKHHGSFSPDLYCVVRDDDKNEGRFHSRADAFREAHEKAGPNAYES